MIRHPFNLSHRRAFTLIELLIVISIIALMMSLSVVVLLGLLDQAEEEATSATVQKVNRLLEQRIEAFDRAFKGARKDAAVNAMRFLLADPNTDGDQSDGIFGVNDAAVEILAKKALFRFEFPQRLDERNLFGDPSTIIVAAGSVPAMPDSMAVAIALPSAKAQLIAEGIAAPTNAEVLDRATKRWQGGTDGFGKTFAGHSAVTESSELLYFALIKSGSFGSAAVDSDRFTGQELQDTDNDGIPEFIDNWGQPLRFYRWPTRLVDTNPMVPFQPDLANLTELTDLDLTPDDNDGDGLREIVSLERNVANLLLKGLPPSPSVLPNGAVPRDLLLIDPDDPVGRLYSELERLDGTDGKPVLALEYNEANYHTPDTFHAPVVMSAGPDEVLGLYEPNDTTNLGNLGAYDATLGYAGVLDAITDNITSRNKKSGGRQ